VARFVGLSQSYIVKLDAGTINSSYRAIKRIIEYLREQEEKIIRYKSILNMHVKNIQAPSFLGCGIGVKRVLMRLIIHEKYKILPLPRLWMKSFH